MIARHALLLWSALLLIGCAGAAKEPNESKEGRRTPLGEVDASFEPNYQAEYRRAAAAVDWDKHFPDGAPWPAIADECRKRLARGLPTGWFADGPAPHVQEWAAQLPPAARDEFAQRCIVQADRIFAGLEALPSRSSFGPAILRPPELYAAAWNVAVSDQIRIEAAQKFAIAAQPAQDEAVVEYLEACDEDDSAWLPSRWKIEEWWPRSSSQQDDSPNATSTSPPRSQE